MTKREETLDKHLNVTLHESNVDAIHDAMEEHAVKFLDWTAKEGWENLGTGMWINHKGDPYVTSKQLYKKFNTETQNKP
jgi:hypothetical protein